jgi:hypothetical protein
MPLDPWAWVFPPGISVVKDSVVEDCPFASGELLIEKI